jgi:hypothetical protein
MELLETYECVGDIYSCGRVMETATHVVYAPAYSGKESEFQTSWWSRDVQSNTSPSRPSQGVSKPKDKYSIPREKEIVKATDNDDSRRGET